MSIRIMFAVWEHSPSEGGRLLVLLALGDIANDDGYAWPSVARLAQKTRLSERQVMRLLRELAAAGEIEMPAGTRNEENPFRVTPMSGVTNCHPDAHVRSDLTPMSGGDLTPTRARVEPSVIEPSMNRHLQELWNHYIERIPSRRRLGEKQRRQLRNALKVRSVEEVKQAIDGLAVSPFHNGLNDQRKTYLELHYAIVPKNAESIEERIDKAIGWAKAAAADRIDPDKRERLLEAVRYTRSLPHRPRQEQADAAQRQLEAAGWTLLFLESPPWVRLER